MTALLFGRIVEGSFFGNLVDEGSIFIASYYVKDARLGRLSGEMHPVLRTGRLAGSRVCCAALGISSKIRSDRSTTGQDVIGKLTEIGRYSYTGVIQGAEMGTVDILQRGIRYSSGYFGQAQTYRSNRRVINYENGWSNKHPKYLLAVF